ncbi:MAG: UvrD-helicase domain-containing protein [Deltaproteobacteria bacterium]|nr:UvrD-helicase domain-containing protein [Deltaproteobacteria bacterium]
MLIDNLPDEQVRNAALDIRRSFHLEAPAGSGKTWLLTGRFLRLLAEVDHPHEIVALTFTNKAAGEMRQRIRDFLTKTEKEEVSQYPYEKILLEAASAARARQPVHRLQAPDGLKIMTFHGFCLHLVQRAPLEAFVPPGSKVMPDEEQRQLRTQVAARTIQDLLYRPSGDSLREALENRLLRLNNNWVALRDELADLLEKRDLLDDLLTLMGHHPDKEQLEEILTGRLELLIKLRLEKCRAAFETTSLGSNWSNFVSHLHEHNADAADRLPEILPPPEGAKLENWQEIATTLTTLEGKPRKRLGPATGFYKGFNNTNWAGTIQELSPESLEHLQNVKKLPPLADGIANIDTLYDLVLVVGEALNRYRSICRQRRLLDYVELEQAALRLFDQESPTDLQLLLDRKIKHLLVDEFQDTSRSQWLLLQHLCSGWQTDSGRTLFVVGDPKQSIYAFRKAEVSLFMEARKGLPLPGQDSLPLEGLQLLANFRSHPHLVHWNNEIFAQTIMSEPDPEADEVVHVAAEALVAPTPDQLSLTLFSSENQVNHPRGAEAEWLGQAVLQELEQLSEGEKIGILLFARTHLPLYLQGLQSAGVAVRVQEGAPLLAQREVMHLRQIAHALVRPQDDLAWAALLRAPWSQLTLDQFVQVASQPEPSWLDKIKTSKKNSSITANVWQAMTKARQRLARDGLAVLVENVWVELDGPEAVASNSSTAGVANCRSYLDILAQAEQGLPEDTLVKAEMLLQNAYAPPDPGAAPSPVELMTVHRAKGLEFDVIFLPFLDWNPLSGGRLSQPPYLVERLPDSRGEHLIAMAPDRRREKRPGLYKLLGDIGNKKKLAEAKRIFYVAVTRARRSLYLSGLVATRDGELFPQNSSPLWWLCNHHQLKLSENQELIAKNNDFLDLYFNPLVTHRSGREKTGIHELPEPLPFSPEPLPYSTFSPSQSIAWDQAPGEHKDDPNRRAKGTVTHRIMEHLSLGGPLPEPVALVAALINEGVPETEAKPLAENILRDVQLCLQEEFCSWLLKQDHPQSYSEWSLEDRPATDKIRTGTVDRIVFDGSDWWVVDYKTSRPLDGESIDSFLERECQLYRPQLLAYGEMVTKYFKVDSGSVRTVLYFTTLQRKVELK